MLAPYAKASTGALVAAFATIYIVWGSTYLAMRVGVETMPPLLFAGTRFLVAGFIMTVFVRVRGEPWPTLQQWRDNAIAGGLLLFLGNGLVIWSEQFIPSGIAALFLGVTPIFMVLIEWALPGGRRPGPYTSLGIVIGFAGIVILAAPWQHFVDPNAASLPVEGVIGVIFSSFFWASGTIFSHHIRNPAPAFTASTIQMLCGGLLLVCGGTFRGELTMVHLDAFSTRSWIAFAYLVVVGSLIAYSTYTWLVKHSTPARISTYAYVNPIVAVFLGWLILDEAVSRRTLVAAAVIIAAVMIIIVRKNQRFT